MIDFVVHSQGDSVGVAVVEGIEAGQVLQGWVMDLDETLTVTVNAEIPIGHKVALSDLAVGETVLKYAHDIGRVVAPIRRGDHVHVHNLKTKRW